MEHLCGPFGDEARHHMIHHGEVGISVRAFRGEDVASDAVEMASDYAQDAQGASGLRDVDAAFEAVARHDAGSLGGGVLDGKVADVCGGDAGD